MENLGPSKAERGIEELLTKLEKVTDEEIERKTSIEKRDYLTKIGAYAGFLGGLTYSVLSGEQESLKYIENMLCGTFGVAGLFYCSHLFSDNILKPIYQKFKKKEE